MKRYGKIVDGAIMYAPIRNGGVLVTDNGMVFAPTEETFIANGYYPIENVDEVGEDAVVDDVLYHYIGQPIDEYVPTYEERVVSFIRERYTIDEELAILRQRDVKPAEFEEYNVYCEQCKTKAREL